MSSSSSNPSGGEDLYIRQSKAAPIQFLIPLIYAPVLPLIRIALRHKPVLRDRLFIGVLAGAVAHGSYLVSLRQREQMKPAEDLCSDQS